MKFRFGYSDAHAAATASTAQILPVILMPFLGICLDKYGKRTWMSMYNFYLTNWSPVPLHNIYIYMYVCMYTK